MKILSLSLLLLLSATIPTNAHDQWANGDPIPAWIKSHCCNGEEAHNLTKEMGVTERDVKAREGGAMIVVPGSDPTTRYIYYRVKGFNNEVVAAQVFPSQDGNIWAFYAQGGPPQASIWCLFVPCVSNARMPQELNGSCS
jgi:hypothetical protein